MFLHSPDENSREIASLVTDQVSAMLAYWDKDEVCRFANEAYQHWFGRSKNDMVGHMTLQELLGPLYDLNKPYIEGALRGEQQVFERDIPLPSGEVRHTLANYFPHEHKGEVQGFFVQVVDVTHAKRLERELRESTRIVSDQNERLLNFAHIVSHNLRSYANNFDGLLRILSTSTDPAEKEKVLQFLQSVASNFLETISHLGQVVDTQVKTHKHLNLEDIKIEALFMRLQNLLKNQIAESGARLELNIEKDLQIHTSPAYLESILMNILTNALKYRDRGRRLHVRVNCSAIHGQLLCTIADNGLGIDTEKYGPQIFGMYKTFHGNKDAVGIGLFLTRLQCNTLHGDISLKSQPGVGSEFTIRLPLSI